MRFLSEKVDALTQKLGKQGLLLLCGVSLVAATKLTAQIDPGLTYQNDAKKINTQLFDRAKTKVAELLPLVENDYSRDIARITAAANKELKRQKQPSQTKILSVDPAMWEVMYAFDDTGNTTARLLNKEASQVGDLILTNADADVGIKNTSIYGTSFYENIPRTHRHHFDQNHGGRVMIPISPYNGSDKVLDIQGLSYKQIQEYTNRHEASHCVDKQFIDHSLDKDSTWIQSNYTPQDPFQNDASKKYTHLAYVRENYADVAALGNMVADGYPIDIIDAVEAWRGQRALDFIHMSVFALQSLKQEITDMGIKTFTRLSPQKRELLYEKIVSQNTLSIEELSQLPDENSPRGASTKYLAFRTLIGEAVDRLEKTAANALDDIAKETEIIEKKKLEIAQHTKDRQPQETIIDAAYAHTGMVTPETMTLAYGRLQNALSRMADAHPSKGFIYREEKAQLQSAFIQNMSKTDYAAENAKRGVPVTKLQEAFNTSKYINTPKTVEKSANVKKPPAQPRI